MTGVAQALSKQPAKAQGTRLSLAVRVTHGSVHFTPDLMPEGSREFKLRVVEDWLYRLSWALPTQGADERRHLSARYESAELQRPPEHSLSPLGEAEQLRREPLAQRELRRLDLLDV